VDVNVRNTGGVAGDEAAELYLEFPAAPGMPIRALRGVQRISLKPGESRRVHFDLDSRGLSSVTAAGNRIVAPGRYRLIVGGGQPNTGAPVATANFSVTGQVALPK